jgi:hypothetical protein
MADFSNAFTGAATGAGLGSPAGFPGMAIGGGLGFLSGLLGFGKDKPEKLMERPRYTPEQQQAMASLLEQVKAGNQQAIDYYNKILSDDPEAFADFERPAMEQFQQQTIPNILERINAGGGMNKYSGAVTQQLAQAGRGLSGDLASQRANLKQNATQGLLNYSQLGLQQQSDPYIQGGRTGAFNQAAPAASAGYGQWLNNISEPQGYKNFMNNFKGGI